MRPSVKREQPGEGKVKDLGSYQENLENEYLEDVANECFKI